MSLPLLEKIIEDFGFYIYPKIDGTFSFGDSLKQVEISVNKRFEVINVKPSIKSRLELMLPQNAEELERARIFLSNLRDLLNEERLGVTREIRARVAQHRYRQTMIDVWGGCAVTGIQQSDLIIASHAKPYSVCSQAESEDKYNGLPLLVHLDCLFDRGYISFENQEILISSKLDKQIIDLWGLQGMRLRKAIEEVEIYLKWHRDNIFLK